MNDQTYKKPQPYYFISYSRQEVTFVDSLSRELEKRGINTWVDIRDLVPGSSWQKQLDDGVEYAEAVLLIVSKQSMASHPVEDEWTKSLARNKRIILIIFEPCEIKAALSHLECVDFTGSFIHAMDKLSALLKLPKGVKGSSDLLPRKRRAYLPQGVLLFLFICFWTTFAAYQYPSNFLSSEAKGLSLIAGTGIASNIFQTIWKLILYFVMIPALWNFSWFFIRIFNRSHNVAKVRNSIYSLAAIGVFSIFLTISEYWLIPNLFDLAGITPFIFPAMILGGCWLMNLLLTSDVMYRWAGPTGAILRSNKYDRKKFKIDEGEGVAVALESAPQDEAYAQAIKASITGAGHTLTETAENAQIVLTLLSAHHPRSNYTPKKDQPLIPVLFQSSRDIDDGDKNPLLENQWIDLRYGQESMDAMAGLLHKPGQLLRTLGVVPIRTAIYPGRVSLLVHVMDYLQSFALIIIAGALFTDLTSYTSTSRSLINIGMYLSIPWLICFFVLRSYITKRKFWLVNNKVRRFFNKVRQNKYVKRIFKPTEKKNVFEKIEEYLNIRLGKIQVSHKFVTWVAVILALFPTIFAWNFPYIFLPFWLMPALISMKEIKMWLPLKISKGQ